MQQLKAAVRQDAHFFHGKILEMVKIFKKDIDKDGFTIIADFSTARATAIEFNCCSMISFPSSKSLLDCVSNLNYLSIFECGLTRINGDELKGLEKLSTLDMGYNLIEYLPKGLFKHTPNLKIVCFDSNKIKYISEDILEPLHNLKHFGLDENESINATYDGINMSLAELRAEIVDKCEPPAFLKELQKEIEALMKENEELKASKATFIQNFTIKLNEKEFRVKKEMLVAHSPVLARLIGENPDAESLELKDVSEAV